MTPRLLRTVAALAAAVLASATAAALLASPSQANGKVDFTVVGTSDVFDSNLIQAVIKPGFEAANPQYNLNYVSKGTGAAITFAEAGTADALVVHAASLENQFVDQGYSTEKYGRAIFWGDYVLLGPASDPAGVMTSDSHDITTAFEKIAAAGAAGNADFVSRGGTPGTTVQEHAIWALTDNAKVTTCTMSDANGGGTSPSTTTGDCPATISYPSWYHATGLTQAPNITAADTCNFPNATNAGANDCYVLTDRGTFNYLQSTAQAQNLHIVTRNNDPAARGGVPLLVNSFHAYAINPKKFAGNANVQLNSTAANLFLSYITSPAAQTAIGNYLNGTNDAPFLPSASPKLTITSSVPASVRGTASVTVRGSIANVVPGYPKLGGVTVDVLGVPTATPTDGPSVVKTATTAADGSFAVTFSPPYSQTYSFLVPTFSKVENSTLSPVFGDILTAKSMALRATSVIGVLRVPSRVLKKTTLTLKGTVAPKPFGVGGKVTLYRGHPGKPLRLSRAVALKAESGTFTAAFSIPKGTWNYTLQYSNPGRTVTAVSPVYRVTVR